MKNARRSFPRDKRARFGWLFLTLRLLLGAMFLYASYEKILNPQAFAKIVHSYQLLPDALINLTALILPWLELILGLCLIVGVWLPGAMGISTGLLTVFIVALITNLIRGLDVHCGCFSMQDDGPAGLATVARDAAIWAVSVFLTIRIFASERLRKRHHAGTA